jgi:hypothetical protein
MYVYVILLFSFVYGWRYVIISPYVYTYTCLCNMYVYVILLFSFVYGW